MLQAYFVAQRLCIDTWSSNFLSTMNTQRVNHFTYVGELDLSERQERNVPFADAFPERGRELLLGNDFDTYASKAEV